MRQTIYPGEADSDLFIVQCGEEECASLHAFGPAEREYYLIHFVASGHGSFYCAGQEWKVGPGQGFWIVPGEETYYQASKEDPWHYAWVGYRGERATLLNAAAGLNVQQRVFTAPNPKAAWDALAIMREDTRSLRLSQMAAQGSLLRFFSLIAPLQDPNPTISIRRQYADKAMWFLEGMYDRGVSIQETADYVGVSRSHLYRIMQEECGCSPKELLLRIRMRHARQLLCKTMLTLDEIAHRTGFASGTQFGAAFRAVYQMSPGKFRKSMKASPEIG